MGKIKIGAERDYSCRDSYFVSIRKGDIMYTTRIESTAENLFENIEKRCKKLGYELTFEKESLM